MQRTAGWLLVGLQGILLLALVLAPHSAPTVARVILGAALVGAGLLLGLVSGVRLGSALTPTPVPVAGARLRTTGPYAVVRHPIYTAVLLGSAGFAVAVGSGWTWLVVGLLAVFFWSKSRWEDSLLEGAYGQEWTEWAARTGALIPRISRP